MSSERGKWERGERMGEGWLRWGGVEMGGRQGWCEKESREDGEDF